jgi:alpha-glucosidase
MRRRILSLLLVMLAAAAVACAETDTVSVASPDGQLVMRLFVVSPKDSILVRLAYSVTFHGKLLIDTSLLGIAIHDQEVFLGETVGLVSATPRSVNAPGNRYNSLIAQYIQNGSLGRRITIEARAYDDGVAFRYYIPRTSTVEDLQIEEELTDFHFAQDGDAYISTLSGYESEKGEYKETRLSAIPRNLLLARPILIEQPGVGWVAITEAQLDNYPGMYLFHPEGTTMRTTLAPLANDASMVMHGMTPAETPWRVLQVAAEPRKLLDSSILENLNPASKIADTSWIKQPRNVASISATASLEEQLAKLPGVDGVRIDLKNRADQQTIELRRHAAEIAAQHHLMIEFQNAPPPDGIERTWLNVVPREDTPFKRLLLSFN